MRSAAAVSRRAGAAWVAGGGVAAVLALGPAPARAQTEVHFQYGKHADPFVENRKPSGTVILTVQHASRWKLGDNFFFVDFIDDGGDDGFNEMDAYGEWYSNLSLGKTTGRELGFGPVADFGLLAGVALGADANFRQWLPGVRISWSPPGFVFLNTDLMLGIDAGRGRDGGSPPELANRFVFDVNGLLPFSLAGQSFAVAGHAEYAAATTDEFGDDKPGSILAQPQLRWDVGRAAGGSANGLHVGVEYQYWSNKLGTDFDESVVQLLVVWGL
ncbi:MAG: nucleoside-binding protein [Gemmatimonadota bacterium]|nr:nucleoside-binding protein [Gemmatimonadota bacterium]